MIFVFGSNLAGRHGAGAALEARNKHGAIYGQGIGRQGNAYAIPTKDGRNGADLKLPSQTLPIITIAGYVREFLAYASQHPELIFNVARIGCGLAGYKDYEIAPLFKDAPSNCNLPEGWRQLSGELQPFKLIVAGGRDFNDYNWAKREIIRLGTVELKDYAVSIVCGMARGADAMGLRFAQEHKVVVHRFPADWDTHGKAAGHIRNKEMGDFADGLLAFWDGKSKGTKGMIEYMRYLGKDVRVIEYGGLG